MSLKSLVDKYRKVAAEPSFTPMLGYERGSSANGGAQFKATGPVGQAMVHLLQNQNKIPRAAGAGLATGAAMLMPAMIQTYYESKNAPTNLGPITPQEQNASDIRIHQAQPYKPIDVPPSDGVTPPLPDTWAQRNLGISLGSNKGDATAGGIAALVGLRAAYEMLKKKQPEE